jgi:putative ABC transport system permease protein
MQFATAMGAMTLAVTWQVRFASNLNPGFNPAQLLTITTPDDMRSANVSAFHDAIKRLPGVAGVALANETITRNSNATSFQREGGKPVNIHWLAVNASFFEVYGIKPESGRLYATATDSGDDNARIVINATAAKALGFGSGEAAIGKFLRSGTNPTQLQIVGIVPEIRHRSAKNSAQPTAYLLQKQTVNTFTVRGTGDLDVLQKEIEKLWPRFFPNALLQINTVQADLASKYQDDARIAQLLAASSVLAMIIAAFGIYVLAAYSVQRASKEIVLRKLYGAGNLAIARLVTREFAMQVGCAALFGLPFAYIGIERYLATFVESALVGCLAMGAALSITIADALYSTLRHTFTAMRITPILALRD